MGQPSPLHEIIQSNSVTWTEQAGWTLPLDYGDSAQEHQNTLTEASLFDCSHHGKLEVTGPDAPAFLHNLSTNDINNLPLGGGCEAYFCNPKAKVMGQALVYHLLIKGSQHAFWLDTAPGTNAKLLQHLDRHLIAERVELADRTNEYAQMHLAGPQAKLILERALGDGIPNLSEFLHMERTFGSHATCHIRRHDPLGVPGFDIVCLKERAEGIWKLLLASGAKPAGCHAFEVLRIEAGTPIYGIDIDENRFVMEVARALRAVSYQKGCYLGQEPIVMARDRAGHVNRAFLGVKVLEGGPLPTGTKLFQETTEVGLVTSSIHSPRLQSPIALAYIRRGHQEPGLKLTAETLEGKRMVEVLPFPPVATS